MQAGKMPLHGRSVDVVVDVVVTVLVGEVIDVVDV